MGGGPALPTPSTPGYGTFTDTNTGRRFTGCYCTIQFLAAAERLGLARGLLKVGLDVVQLTGGAAASGNTHSLGAAFDVKQVSDPWVRIFREMGAAYWPRLDDPTRSDDLWDDNQHGHGVIDCAHDANCSYQYTAYWRGYSGLGQAKTGTYAGMWGYGSKDPDPWRPSVRRTWREGIAWADAETKRLTTKPTPAPAPAPTPVPEEDIMATAADLREIIREELLNKEYLREVARFVLTGYAFDHDMDPNTPEGVLSYAIRDLVTKARAGAVLASGESDKIAAAVAAKVPAGSAPSREDIEAALRSVLGSLDNNQGA